MIPIDQEFFVCLYCNQHVNITPSNKLNNLTLSQTRLLPFDCLNCKITYKISYYKYDQKIVIDHLFIHIKNNIQLIVNLFNWHDGLTLVKVSPNKISYIVITKMNELDKNKLIEMPINKLRSKVSNLLAFI